MERIFRHITIQDGNTTKRIYINVNLVESIEESKTGVYIKMQYGNGWVALEEPIYMIIERFQSK